MPKNKLEDAVFTAIMATVMVYGMIVYNVALNTGKVDGTTFLAATHELIFMAPIAFILEFFIVGKIAAKLAFTVIEPSLKAIKKPIKSSVFSFRVIFRVICEICTKHRDYFGGYCISLIS